MTRRINGMIIYKTESEIALMKESATLVSKTLTEVAKVLKAGMTTLQIDRLCATFVKDHKAIPSFLNYRGYPHNICASVNDVVVHGFPNNIALKEGDIREVPSLASCWISARRRAAISAVRLRSRSGCSEVTCPKLKKSISLGRPAQ